MNNKDFLSTLEVAKMLGISRIAVFKQIKSGRLKAKKVGRSFVIARRDLPEIFGLPVSEAQKEEIERVVNKAVKQYGEVFKLLGKE